MQNGENCGFILRHYCGLASGKVIGLDLSFMNRGTSYKQEFHTILIRA